MTAEKVETSSSDTVSVMRQTAASLEAAEQVLHRSAEASPSDAVRDRLHRIGDGVSAEAQGIARRADDLCEERDLPS
jgi:ElaB/YqjD/DUF883 family membrane-anchored ribosome-binding protein